MKLVIWIIITINDDVLIYNGTRWVNTQLTNNETLISSLVDRILTKETINILN